MGMDKLGGRKSMYSMGWAVDDKCARAKELTAATMVCLMRVNDLLSPAGRVAPAAEALKCTLLAIDELQDLACAQAADLRAAGLMLLDKE